MTLAATTKRKVKTKTSLELASTRKKNNDERATSTELVFTKATKQNQDEPAERVKKTRVKIVEPTKEKEKPQRKKTKKAKSPPPVSSESESEVAEEKEGKEPEAEAHPEDEDQDVHLHGFSTDEDSSDEEEEETGGERPGLSAFEISKLPTVAKDDQSVKQRLEKAKRQPVEDRGVIYISRLPHGFYEDQLRGYFSQFGDITRLRVSRNKKTGKCKHYGFIEFESSSVAQVVAETMDNYLLSGHILKCKLIPKDKVHPELWIGANRKWRVVPRDRIFRAQHNKTRTEMQQTKVEKRLIKRENERKRKLEAFGIDYDYSTVSYKKPKATKKK